MRPSSEQLNDLAGYAVVGSDYGNVIPNTTQQALIRLLVDFGEQVLDYSLGPAPAEK